MNLQPEHGLSLVKSMMVVGVKVLSSQDSCRNSRISPLPLRAEKYSFYTIMGFVFDPEKSAQSLAKHGIDFEDAQRLWEDPDLLEIPARNEDEPRYPSSAELAPDIGQV